MTEPRDIIRRNDTSNKLNLYRTVNDRTLSEEYNSYSPINKERIKSMCGTSPTSNFNDNAYSSSRITEIGRSETNIKYMNSNIYERAVMAQYGIVSTDYHDKNKDCNIKDAEK